MPPSSRKERGGFYIFLRIAIDIPAENRYSIIVCVPNTGTK